MLRKHVMVVIMLMVSLVGACAPQAGSFTPTPVAKGAAPKATSGAVSVATPKPVAEKPQRGGTLVYAMSGEAGELDPIKVTAGISRRPIRLMFNSLVTTDKDGNIVPELAESWTNPDSKTYVFKLRKGVKFHDGTDFNAKAVKFNIERIWDPATKMPQNIRANVDNIASVEIVDDYTVRFNLKNPAASFLGSLTNIYAPGIFSPTAAKKWGDDTVTHPVGTGPFEFVEWVKGDHITVKRFAGYWRKDEYGDPLPYLDQVIVKPILDQSVILTNLRTGNADLTADISPAQLTLVKGDKDLKMADFGSERPRLTLHNGKPPFDNKALRQAVAWAIDREAIHKAVYGGTGEAGRYILDPRQWAFDPNGKFYTKDNAKAKAKLVEGGKPNGFKFEAKFDNSPLILQLAQALKGQLAEVGIDMEIVPVEVRQMGADRTAGNFEAAFTPASGMEPDPDMDLYRYFYSKGSLQYARYSNPEVDKLLDRARVIYDQAERKTLYAQVQALVLEDSPLIFLHTGPVTVVMNQKVMGFVPSNDLYHIVLDWAWLKK